MDAETRPETARALLYDHGRGLWISDTGREAPLLVGLSPQRLEEIGELAYLLCPAVGTRVERGQPMGSLEAAKMTDTLTAPVSGVVTAVNAEAMRTPACVNRDPYGAGWLVAIAPDRWPEEAAALHHDAPPASPGAASDDFARVRGAR